MKHPKVSLTLLGALVATPLCHAQSTQYFFRQLGYSGGGSVYGTFTGYDADLDGAIVYFSPVFSPGAPMEIESLNFTFSGDSVIPDFAGDLATLSGLLWAPAYGSFLGDDSVYGVEGFAWNWRGENTNFPIYEAGLGPYGDVGGAIALYGSPEMTSTLRPIEVSAQPFAAVPEPGTYGLMGAGALLGLAFLRRRRKS